jgi:Alpha-galactosidase
MRRRGGRTVAQSLAQSLAVVFTVIAVTAASAPLRTTGELAPAPRLAQTPPMGWNDWNAFGCDVNAALVERTADLMAENGMRAAGYRYVNIDDCWMLRHRDRAGDLVPDPAKFPNGIREVADYVHARGLKLGIYEDAGTETCEGYPGSLGHERRDAALFAAWGVDYLKYDNCHNAGLTTRAQYIARYTAMRDALTATGRPIVFGVCEWGERRPWSWAPGTAELWRSTHDIKDDYAHLLRNFTQNVGLYAFAGPGGWNDPDMLEVGNGGMSTAEYRAEFSLWAVMAAPLLAGTDLRSIAAADRAIYLNRDVIAVDQDAAGRQGVPIASSNGHWVIVKRLRDGDRAVVLFNASGRTAEFGTTAAVAGLPLAPGYATTDLWSKKVTVTSGGIRATVPPHSAVMYRVAATLLRPTR